MTQQPAAGAVPELTLGWRLKMALGHHMSAQEMADELGVSRQTLSRWMGDSGSPPARAYIAQWSLITGVPFEWLMTGRYSDNGPDKGGQGCGVITRGYPSLTSVTLYPIHKPRSLSAQDSPNVAPLTQQAA